MTVSSQPVDGKTTEVVDWSDLGQRMWSFLTGREAAINYTFKDLTVEIPRDTGSNAPRATWKVDGTLTVTTHDSDTRPSTDETDVTTLDLSASLTVEVATPTGETATGHLSGEHGHLTLDVDNPGAVRGLGRRRAVRGVAEELATRGISVRVVHDGVHLVTLGAVSAPWWQRRATGSRRIRVGSWRGAWTSLRSRAGHHDAVLPSAEALPPPTLLPLVPTLARHPRRPATTTHDPPAPARHASSSRRRRCGRASASPCSGSATPSRPSAPTRRATSCCRTSRAPGRRRARRDRRVPPREPVSRDTRSTGPSSRSPPSCGPAPAWTSDHTPSRSSARSTPTTVAPSAAARAARSDISAANPHGLPCRSRNRPLMT